MRENKSGRALHITKRFGMGGLFLFLILAGAAGCSSQSTQNSGPLHLAVIIGAHANAPRANTSVMYDAVLEACTRSGSTISLIVNDGAPYASVVTVPETKQGLSAEKYEAIAKERAGQILELADGMRAKTEESDLLSAVALAGRQLQAEEGGTKELVIIDSGLTTTPPLDFSESLLENITAENVTELLEEQRALPDLQGVDSVRFFNIGDVAGPQSRITEANRKMLMEVWEGILAKSGAEEIRFQTDLPLSAVYGEGEVPEVSTVAVMERASALESAEVDFGEVDAVSFDEETIAFHPDTEELVDREAAKAALEGTAVYMEGHPEFRAMLVGTTAKFGDPKSCVSLSQKRAEAVKTLLTELGVDAERLETAGTGYDNPFYKDDWKDGVLDEAAAAQNRAVVLIDASGEPAGRIRCSSRPVRP